MASRNSRRSVRTRDAEEADTSVLEFSSSSGQFNSRTKNVACAASSSSAMGSWNHVEYGGYADPRSAESGSTSERSRYAEALGRDSLARLREQSEAVRGMVLSGTSPCRFPPGESQSVDQGRESPVNRSVSSGTPTVLRHECDGGFRSGRVLPGNTSGMEGTAGSRADRDFWDEDEYAAAVDGRRQVPRGIQRYQWGVVDCE